MAAQYVFNGRCKGDRIAAGKGALAFNGYCDGRIVDCSLDDLCFQYSGNESASILCHACKTMAADSLDIAFDAHDFSLINLPVASLADYPVSVLHAGGPGRILRFRHVIFGQLNPKQLFSLKRFLELGNFAGPAKSRPANTARFVSC